MFGDVVRTNGTEKSDIVVAMVTSHLVVAGSMGPLNEKRCSHEKKKLARNINFCEERDVFVFSCKLT